MQKLKSFLFFFTLILTGCTSNFLELEEISRLDKTSNAEHSLIFYQKNYTLTKQFGLKEQTHFLLKIGENLNSTPEILYVYDNSIFKLEDFDARIIKKNGSTKTYSKGDLRTYNLSSGRMISQSLLKYVPVFEHLTTGDIVEVTYSHINTLPQLGIEFSLDELDLPSNNISLNISIPKELKLNYKTINNFPEPIISSTEDSKLYAFYIDNYQRTVTNFLFGKKNTEPEVLISLPDKYTDNFSWKDFGDWYLNLIANKIKSDSEIETLAKEITEGLNTTKEKIDAIFNYCQKNIRYEQVYLSKGEFIPNDCKTILARKYGDCKDYATAIYVLGKSIGLNLNLALCYRGRGLEFYDDIPVSQFNHMIVYYSDGEKDYWYDGTNRIGIPGITTSDLINQKALVLEKGNSRLKKIDCNKSNLLRISGVLKTTNKNLIGSLTIDLQEQYAITFSYLKIYLNKNDMTDYISQWLKNNLCESLLIKDINWDEGNEKFSIKTDCEIPNSILKINESCYLSLDRIFPGLFPSLEIKDTNKIFYYPFYDKVSIDIQLPGLKEETALQAYNIDLNYSVPPGPFNKEEKSAFLSQYEKIKEKFNSKIKLVEEYK